MKKLNYLLLLFVMIMTSGVFTSCEPPEPELAPADAVAGTYVGTGKLMYFEIIEDRVFAGMKIILTRSSDEYVLATLEEADGSEIFTETFLVTKASNDYILICEDNRNIKLTIDSNFNMEYKNPKVYVGDESGYSIIFSGRRQ